MLRIVREVQAKLFARTPVVALFQARGSKTEVATLAGLARRDAGKDGADQAREESEGQAHGASSGEGGVQQCSSPGGPGKIERKKWIEGRCGFCRIRVSRLRVSRLRVSGRRCAAANPQAGGLTPPVNFHSA